METLEIVLNYLKKITRLEAGQNTGNIWELVMTLQMQYIKRIFNEPTVASFKGVARQRNGLAGAQSISTRCN